MQPGVPTPHIFGVLYVSALNVTHYLDTTAGGQELALKVYTGLFQEAWRQQVYLWDAPGVVERLRASEGKSHQVLQFADLPDAEEFNPGDEMLGQNFAIGEVTISVDKYLVSHASIPRDDMKIGHESRVMGKLAPAQARKIGQRYDKRMFSLACQAARAAAVTKNGLTIHNGGNRVTRSGTASVATAFPASANGATNLRADLRLLSQRMDEDNIPPENRRLWLRPDMKTVLLYDNTAQLFSFDYIKGASMGNDINDASVVKLEGFSVVGFPNTTTNGGPFPDSNITTDSISKYNANFSIQASNGTPVALVLCSGPEGQAAVAAVTYDEVQHFVKYEETKLAWVVASFTLMGAGIVSPYCAGSVEVIV